MKQHMHMSKQALDTATNAACTFKRPTILQGPLAQHVPVVRPEPQALRVQQLQPFQVANSHSMVAESWRVPQLPLSSISFSCCTQ